MDLSNYGKTHDFRKELIAYSPAMIGTVPMYDAIGYLEKDLMDIKAKDFLKVVQAHAEEGVDFMTIHAGINKRAVECFKRTKRMTNIVSVSYTHLWNLRSKAASFSICLRYSSIVVAPINWNSPRAKDGFKIFAASAEPSAAPAPIMVWISSINRMILPLFFTSSIAALMRSSKSPLYLVPATILVKSSATTPVSYTHLVYFKTMTMTFVN